MSEPVERTAEPREEAGFGRSVIELFVMLGLAFVLALGIKTWIVQPFLVPSGSLEPTIHVGDRVLVNKFIYRFHAPQRGDIVVFPDPNNRLPALIKRVIAVGGDTVDIRNDHVYLNGKALDEPYTHGKPTVPGTVRTPITIPAGDVWLMGDNRTDSQDARWFGPQPVSGVEGKAFCIYWPLDHLGGL